MGGYLDIESFGPSFGRFENSTTEKITHFGFLVAIEGVLANKLIALSFEDGSNAHLKVTSNLVFFEILERAKGFIRTWEKVFKRLATNHICIYFNLNQMTVLG